VGTIGNRDSENLRVTPVDAPEGEAALKLTGELDLSTVEIFVDALNSVLEAPPATVVLDMSELGFIDSSGVGAYVTAYRKAQAKGCSLRVGARSNLVERVLELSGVEEALAQEAAEQA
jgi:anti-anti-sigma factor